MVREKGKGKAVQEAPSRPPPKKKAPTKGSSSGGFDRTRFVSKSAEERYAKLVKRSIIHERGFDLEEGEYEHIQNAFSLRRLSPFAAQPGPANADVVREFYANLQEAEEDKVFVRGKLVDISHVALNHYIGCHVPKQCGLVEVIRGNPSRMTVFSTICEGIDWETEDPYNFAATRSALTDEAIIWHFFMCHRLYPTKHFTTLQDERACMVYCLMSSIQFNVGFWINKLMIRTNNDPRLSLPYGSFLTAYFESLEVPLRVSEMVNPDTVMNKKWIDSLLRQRLRERNKRQRQREREQFQPEEEEPEEEEEDEDFMEEDEGQTGNRDVYDLVRQQGEAAERHMAAMMAHQQAQGHYLGQMAGTFNEWWRRAAEHQGWPNMDTFPQIPPWAPPQPPQQPQPPPGGPYYPQYPPPGGPYYPPPPM